MVYINDVFPLLAQTSFFMKLHQKDPAFYKQDPLSVNKP